MKNILKLAAALLVLSSSASVSASSTPTRVAQPTQGSAYREITIIRTPVTRSSGLHRHCVRCGPYLERCTGRG